MTGTSRLWTQGLPRTLASVSKPSRRQLEGEEMFLANYTDGLSDVPLPAVIESFKDSENVACFVGVKPRASFHLIDDGVQVAS